MRIILIVVVALVASAQTNINKVRVIPNSTKTAVGEIDFAAKNNVHSVGLAAPDVVDANVRFRLPAEDGAPGACLATDGSGALDFSGCGGGSANSVTVNSSHPLYLAVHFRDDDQKTVWLSYTRDGIHFSDVNPHGSFSNDNNFRDPTMLRAPNGTYYFLDTVNEFITAGCCFMDFESSTDLQSFNQLPAIQMTDWIPGATQVWNPNFIVDPISGNTYFTVSASTDHLVTMNPYLFRFDPATGTIVSAVMLTLTGNDKPRVYDHNLIYSPADSKYYMFFAQDNAAGKQYLGWATSTTLTGTYTVQSGAWDADPMGFSNYSPPVGYPPISAEAPWPMLLTNGCMRVYADTFTYLFNGYRHYSREYVDSCSATPMATIGTVQHTLGSNYQHGNMIPLTTAAQANVVYQAAAQYASDSQELSTMCLNCTTDLYPDTRFPQDYFTFTIRSKAEWVPGENLTNDEPPTFAADPGSGNNATWSGCDSNPATIAIQVAAGLDADSPDQPFCQPPIGSGGRWLMNVNNGYGGGNIQINNALSGYAGAAIQLSDGLTTWGQNPVAMFSGAPNPKAIWELGENSQCYGPGFADCSNIANNWFYIFNHGLGDYAFSISPTSGQIHSNYGITFGSGGVDISNHVQRANIDAVGSSLTTCPNCGNRINVGTGAVGNRDAYLLTGSTELKGFLAQQGTSNTSLSGALLMSSGVAPENETAVPASNHVIVGFSSTWVSDIEVDDMDAGGVAMTKVASAPGAGQYSVSGGNYTFATGFTHQVSITYFRTFVGSYLIFPTQDTQYWVGQPACFASDATNTSAIIPYTSPSKPYFLRLFGGSTGDFVNYFCVARSY